MEQGHRRSEFDVIRLAENGCDRSLWDRNYQPGTLDKTRSKHVMSKVGLRLGPRPDCVALRHCAEAQSFDLREDEPHPMALLSARREFFDDPVINAVLTVYEAVEVELAHLDASMVVDRVEA